MFKTRLNIVVLSSSLRSLSRILCNILFYNCLLFILSAPSISPTSKIYMLSCLSKYTTSYSLFLINSESKIIFTYLKKKQVVSWVHSNIEKSYPDLCDYELHFTFLIPMQLILLELT